MNPSLPLLAVLSLAPLALFRGRAKTWAVMGLAGMVFLAPVLFQAHGIPSSAASAAAFAPWTGITDPAKGNPTLNDVTFQIQPWLLFLREELRAGRAPFWNPHQFAGAPFWANGQSAPLFPLHLLFAALPLQLGFVLLPWLRIVIAGCGSAALARTLGASRDGSLIAGLVFPLSGMMSSFLLFPMANSLCLVPWVLLSVERLACGTGTWWGLAAVVGAQGLGGHPETLIHSALLGAIYLLARGAHKPVVCWKRFLAGWCVGTALAGIQLAPLILNILQTARWQESGPGGSIPAAILLSLPLRLALPELFGNPARGTWWGPFQYNATAAFAGILPLVLASMGASLVRKDKLVRGCVAILLFSAAAAYQLPGLREALLAIPGLRSMLHHRLLFGVDLALGLLAAVGWDLWRARVAGRSGAVGALFAALLIALAWWRFRTEWAEHGLSREEWLWTVWAATAILLVVAWPPALRARGRAAWAIPVLVLAELVMAHIRTNPALDLNLLFPVTPGVAFLQGQEGRVSGVDATLRPNSSMVYGLYDVRGDDTLQLARYKRFYRQASQGSDLAAAPFPIWMDPAWDAAGLRWVMSAAGDEPPDLTWRLAYDGPDARVFERPSALPPVRWRDGSAEGLTILGRVPGRWAIRWTCDHVETLIVAETWEPGWSALLEGKALPVGHDEDPFLTVSLGPGEGRLELRYWPPGLIWGLILSFGSLCFLADAALRPRWARGREAR